MNRTRFSRWALLAATALFTATISQAQQNPPAGEPVVVARASIASVDDLQKLITELGIPNMTNLMEDLEEGPFLGKGSVAANRPLGVVVLAADPHKLAPIQDSVVFGIPVLEGKVTPEQLVTRGGKAVEGRPGFVTVENFLVRRSAGYAFFKAESTAWGLSSVNDDVFAADHRPAEGSVNVFAGSVHLDAMRKAAPEAYKDLAKEIVILPRMIFGLGLPADDTKPVTNVLDKVDRFSMALSRDAKDLHLRSWLSPTPIAARVKEAPRPAFPTGTIAQVHVIYPDAKSAEFLEQHLTALPDEFFAGEMPPVYHARAKELVMQLVALNTATDAGSFGFAMRDGLPVFYIVDQFSGEFDGLKEIKEVVEKGVALLAEGAGVKITLEASEYDAAGKKVQRFVLKPEAGEMALALMKGLVVDVVQNGKTLYVAISPSLTGKYLPDLVAAGMSGSSSLLCAGAIDLGAAVRAAAEMGGLPGMGTPDELELLKTKFAGQGITWTVQASEQNFLYVDISVPTAAVKELIKLD